ncbi:MAG: TonB-dependent receptor [Gammaproteobacteria bacterium]
MTFHSKFILFNIVLFISSITISPNSFAQTQLEEIVVTAQKRTQNLQDVPITVQAFSAQALADRGLSKLTDIANFTPNVELDYTSAFSGSTQILGAYVRGIGQQDFAFNLEPGVGVYIDGVYFARSTGSVVDLLDLENIEVLKGPQGTLFGRNTIGGALNIVTRRPAEEFGYTAEVTTGRYDRVDIRGSADVPLIDDVLYSQISFSSKNREGYHKRLAYPDAQQYRSNVGRFVGSGEEEYYTEQGNENTDTIRGKLLWHTSSDVEVLISADYTRVDEQAAPNTLVDTFPDSPANGTFGWLYNTCVNKSRPGEGFPTPTPGPPPVPAFELACDADIEGLGDGSSLSGVNTDNIDGNDHLTYGDHFLTGDIDASYSNSANFSKLEAWGISSTINWAISDNLNLKSITAYRKQKSAFGQDQDGSPIVINDTSFYQEQKQISQEIQLNGLSFDSRLNWVFGLYYFHEEGDLIDYPIFGGGLLQIFGPNVLDNDAFAVFGHLNYQFTDHISFTAGLRYTHEDKTFTGMQRDLNRFAALTGFPDFAHPVPTDTQIYFPPGENNRKFNNVSPKLGIEYRFNEDIFTFFSWSKGFKSGGWTTRATVPIVAAPEFEEETATTYEVGIKTELFDRTARINVSAFLTDYQDLQVTVQRGLSPFFENAGQSEIKGIEADFEWLATEKLAITGAVGFIDAEYTELDAVSVIKTDFKFNNTPNKSLTLAGNYLTPFKNGSSLRWRVDYSYRSRQANDAENTPELFSDAVSLFSASVSYRPPSDRWEVALGGTNLTDKRYIVSGFRQPGSGAIDGTYSRPREWYLTFRLFSE